MSDIDNTTKNSDGRSIYPKMVYPQGNAYSGTLVNNVAEEKKVMGKKYQERDGEGANKPPVETPPNQQPPGWGNGGNQ